MGFSLFDKIYKSILLNEAPHIYIDDFLAIDFRYEDLPKEIRNYNTIKQKTANVLKKIFQKASDVDLNTFCEPILNELITHPMVITILNLAKKTPSEFKEEIMALIQSKQ